ncbi:hypothetical protein LAV60_15675 [Clostridium sporogenes]|uniref:hypothetical protein n=1 Tax=Clostridium sporogenes TaxID=1509 RepID=UPI002237AF2C|nr:hypothetical protein [Clostridium sporogenes]MCW6094611.1 hypothetical protein [Clostridium sporogenes]
MNWVDIQTELPPDNNKVGGKTYIVTVSCRYWEKPSTMIMEWECTKIKNKEVKRWKYNNRIKIEGWIVTHWMELPYPAIN